MNEKDCAIICITAIVIFILFVGFLCLQEQRIWNNGRCSCGGKWEYEQAIGHRNSTTYMYICDKCGKRHEFSDVR